MNRTISRLFDSRSRAVAAVQALEDAGVDRGDISLIASDAEGVGKSWRDGDHDGENDAVDGAGDGATAGGVIGGAGGLLAGLGMLAIPGLGPVVAVGWLASTAVGALAGAAVGAAAGGLLGALKDAGHSDEDAHVYAEGVRRGGTLVSVRCTETHAAEIERILDSHAGVSASTRGQAYRSAGWSSYDPAAPALSADEIRRERGLYGSSETRSFARSESDLGEFEDDGVRASRTDPDSLDRRV